MMKVGVPRALSYYRYFPLWSTLLEGIGAEVVLSSQTGKDLLEAGVRQCVDDICVPVKLYYGHVLDLAGKCDRLFVSRLVSVEKADSDTYTCPKLIGLPDMIKSSLEGLPPMVEFTVDIQNRSLKSSIKRLCAELGASSSQVREAIPRALEVQKRYEEELLAGLRPSDAMKKVMRNGNAASSEGDSMAGPGERGDINIALVGHEYLIHDYYISHDLPAKLDRLGANVTYMAQVPADAIENELSRYDGISWTYEKELLGAASYFLRRPDIDGVMLVEGFACGPDSIIGEIITREVVRDSGPPLTTLVLDEHTGEAGVATRVEAFVDLIRRASRKKK
ncbi:MAG: acyl-CoA dehydratase activase-related protein [Candidatus Geothermincolia bacterium]